MHIEFKQNGVSQYSGPNARQSSDDPDEEASDGETNHIFSGAFEIARNELVSNLLLVLILSTLQEDGDRSQQATADDKKAEETPVKGCAPGDTNDGWGVA